jgi:simple sugar transport system permease protein
MKPLVHAWRRTMRSSFGSSLVAAACAIAVVMVVVLASGYDVGRAATAFWNGSAGSAYSFFSETLVRATPLIFVGLAVALAFQGGVLNIGAEGQLLTGATAAVAIGLWGAGWPGWITVPLELAGGIVAGAAWASIAAVLKRRFGVLEVISTLMLNFVAQYGVSYLVRGPLEEPTHLYPQTSLLGVAARLPMLVRGQQVTVGLPLAVILAGLAWWALRSTAEGFRIRVAGAGPAAAASAGRVNVERVVFTTFLLSGAIAGLAGAVQVTGVTYALYENLSPGWGYTAIAVALLARLDAAGVVVTGLFFGTLEAGGGAMQRDAGVPAGFVYVIEALVILGVMAVDRARNRASVHHAPVAAEPVT